jgi:hypothetical protein
MNANFSRFNLVNNFLTFQLGWFVNAYWHNEFSILFSVVLLIWLSYTESWPVSRIKFTSVIALTGVLVDSLLVYLGLLSFDSKVLPIPFWFLMLWVLFACSCSVSLLWLIKNPLYAIIGGAIFGPLSYWAGMQFNALQIVGVNGYIAISVTWALMMGLFSLLYSKSNKLNFLGSQRI